VRVVIYTRDFEPITVISVSNGELDYVERIGRVRLPVYERLTLAKLDIPDLMVREARIVTLHAERVRFRVGGKPVTFLVTEDEESALLLEAAFLPGQLGAVQERERLSFAKGFLDAFERLARGAE
jgi:hypothetical protein